VSIDEVRKNAAAMSGVARRVGCAYVSALGDAEMDVVFAQVPLEERVTAMDSATNHRVLWCTPTAARYAEVSRTVYRATDKLA
jgi:hypothetical protein